ncbi:hypothetical protein [Ekhidna sp.]
MKWIAFTLIIFTYLKAAGQEQQENKNSEKICLAVTCGDVGFTKCFRNSDDLVSFLFINEVDKVNSNAGLKSLDKTEIAVQYPGMEKYCNRLVKLNIKKKQFDQLSEEFKQRLSGI